MRLEAIDQNFKLETQLKEPDMVWLDVKCPPFAVDGVFYDPVRRCYLRMPQETADTVSQGVSSLNCHTAGGRVRFKTDSTCIAIEVRMEVQSLMPHFTRLGQSGLDLYRKTGERSCYTASLMPPTEMKTGYSAEVKTDGRYAEYTLNLPLYDGVKELYIGLKRGALLEAPDPYPNRSPVVFYGSSITQGGCASRPGNSYPAILSRRLGIDYLNLGFSGGCRAEKAICRYLAELPIRAFVCDYDHNAPDAEYLKSTHLPLYRAVRRGHPGLPILLVSAPGPKPMEGAWQQRRDIVRATYETARSEGDGNIFFIDGGELFAGEEWDACTVDGTHPNDLGFFRMAMGIEGTLKAALGLEKI